MREEKQLLLNEIKEKIDQSSAFVVATYDKLPPNESWGLRDRLAKKGSLLEIVRKRVFLKAAKQSGIELDEALLKGHIGIVFVKQADPMDPTKELLKFSDENGKTLALVCGQIEGKFVPAADLEYLSKLPGIQEMRSQFLALLVSPMAQTLSVMDAAIKGPLANGATEQKS